MDLSVIVIMHQNALHVQISFFGHRALSSYPERPIVMASTICEDCFRGRGVL